jgi:hypothetical protein
VWGSGGVNAFEGQYWYRAKLRAKVVIVMKGKIMEKVIEAGEDCRRGAELTVERRQ